MQYILPPLPGGRPGHDRREELKALALDPVPVYRDTASRLLSTTHRPGEVIRRLTVGRYHPAYLQPNTQSHGTGRAPGVGLEVCKIIGSFFGTQGGSKFLHYFEKIKEAIQPLLLSNTSCHIKQPNHEINNASSYA